jgi:hypothetical protein
VVAVAQAMMFLVPADLAAVAMDKIIQQPLQLQAMLT